MSEAEAAGFMAHAHDLHAREPQRLTLLGAGLIAALDLGIARDSRGFSQVLGMEHSLVLREISRLAGPEGFLAITARQPRTLRTSLALAPRGQALVARTAHDA